MIRARSRSPRLLARLAPLLLASLSILSFASPARADWPSSPFTNVPVCTAAGFQVSPRIVTDGAFGAFILWGDQGAVDIHIYVSRVLADGTAAPGWPANGRAVCTAPGGKSGLRIVSDGLGGAMMAWHDNRSGIGSDIYASHVLADGSLDPAWPADGSLVCSADSSQFLSAMIGDGAGGAYLSWRDLRSRTNSDIYIQHLLPTGVEDPNWPECGLLVCNAPGDQSGGALVLGASGSVLVTWSDTRSGVSDIYSQRVLANGTLDPTWPLDGRAVCTAAGMQQLPVIDSDGAGGAFLVWQDLRSGDADAFAARVWANGALDPAWPIDGAAVCTVLGEQGFIGIVASGPGAAIVTWRDRRNSLMDIYAARLIASGLDPLWPANGLGVCLAVGNQTTPVLASDGAGGALIAWDDSRAGSNDIYAQHVLQSGVVDPGWQLEGSPVSRAANQQQSPTLIADGTGGAIVAWHDSRAPSTAIDIYAQRIRADGTLGGTVVSVPPSADATFAIHGLHPNPWRGGALSVDFSLGVQRELTLEVLDVAGRRLLARDLGTLAPGRHSATVDLGPRARAGVRFVRLRQGEETRSLRVSVVE